MWSWSPRISPEWAEQVKWEFHTKGHKCLMPELLLAFQALFLGTENSSKITALISLPMLTEHQLAVSTASSTSFSFPPGNSRVREGSTCNTSILQGHLATWLLTVAFLRSRCISPLESCARLTMVLHCVPARKVAQGLLCCSSGCFSLLLKLIQLLCFLAAACAAGLRDPWQLLGPWAGRSVEIKSAQCFLWRSLTDDSYVQLSCT